MSEASLCSYEAKQAIAQTIVNRVRDGRWGSTVTDVVNYSGQYWMGDNGEPNGECKQSVEGALIYEAWATDMYYFKEGEYHDFGKPYEVIGTTHFTREEE